MSKEYADILESQVLESDAALVDHINHNDPTNHANVNVINANGNHVVLKSDTDEIGPLSLMVGDDSAASGEGGYAAACHYLTESGERIATESADTTHGHWGVYTTASTLGDGTDTQPEKRLQIGGESDVVNAEFSKINQLRLRSQTQGKQMRLIASSGSGADTYLKLREGGNDRAIFWYDADKSLVRIRNTGGSTATHLQLQGDGSVKVPTGGPAGAGRIEFANSALYENGSGEVVVEDSAGNTTVLS